MHQCSMYRVTGNAYLSSVWIVFIVCCRGGCRHYVDLSYQHHHTQSHCNHEQGRNQRYSVGSQSS